MYGNELPRPRIVYPEVLNYSEPVPVHVVAGQIAILECVIWDAKVVWNKADYSMQQISLTDDRARIRQIWGNLRIKYAYFYITIEWSLGRFRSEMLGNMNAMAFHL